MTSASENRKRGILFIVSAPSGAGKTTMCQAALKHFSEIRYSVSYTTRTPRGSEIHGKDYYFISKEEFARGIASGKWAEWAEVHGNYYGTSAELLDQTLAAGMDMLLDIDVQGTEKILKRYPDAVTIFIMPPCFDELRIRMESRGTDSPEVIARRVENAKGEIARKDSYLHIIVNDNLSEATARMISVIENSRNGKAEK
ncbi:MAG: guanylate kinase [Desulfobacterales bacterium]